MDKSWKSHEMSYQGAETLCNVGISLSKDRYYSLEILSVSVSYVSIDVTKCHIILLWCVNRDMFD